MSSLKDFQKKAVQRETTEEVPEGAEHAADTGSPLPKKPGKGHDHGSPGAGTLPDRKATAKKGSRKKI